MSTRDVAKPEPASKRSSAVPKASPVNVQSNHALLAAVDAQDRAAEEAHAEAFADGVAPGARPRAAQFGTSPLAVTRGGRTRFAGNAPALDTPAGRWLWAHELAHAHQQRTGPDRARAYVPGQAFHDPDSDIMSDVPDAIPKDPSDPTSGVDIDQVVDVAAPLLKGQRRRGKDEDQRWHLHSEGTKIPLSAFAVPRAKLTLDPARAQPAAVAGPAQPDIAVGSHVYAPHGVELAVLGSDSANVIVEGTAAVHYAVGAGSCVLVETSSGLYLFDAGINIHEGHALAEAMAAKIVAHANGRPIRAVFLTHGHFDHIALLKWLASKLQIDAIVANPLQFTREEYKKNRDAVREGDRQRRAEKALEIESDLSAKDEYLKSLEEDGSDKTLNDLDADAEWKKEVARRVLKEFPEMKEVPAMPIRGSRGTEFDTAGTHPLHQIDKVEGDFDIESLLPESAGELRGIVDPSMHGRKNKPLGDNDQEVDSMSTTWILTIDGRRLVMMPDLRRTDIVNLKKELTEALGDRAVDFQEWVLGHHAQAGFLEQSAGEGKVVSARTLRKTLELLHEFRARGTGGARGHDVAIASVDPALVDPAQLRLLRLLGFETYLARSQNDVRTYDIMSGGKLIRGVRGPLSPEAEGEATLERAIAGKKQLKADIAELRARRNALRGKGTGKARGELSDKIKLKGKQIAEITPLQHDVIDAARAKPFDPSRLSAAEAKLNAALDAAGVGKVVLSSSRVTDTALVLLRQPLGPEPDEGSPEAAQREKDVALRRQKALVDELRERANEAAPEARVDAYAELYAEIAVYDRLLEEAKETHGGLTAEIAAAEQARINVDRGHLDTALQGQGETQVARLPDGSPVENKVVRISGNEPGAGGKLSAQGKLSQSMLKGLGYVGRTMGAVMVISTIRGSRDLIENYQRGNATLAQLGIGGTKQFVNGIVSLRMLTGAHVPSGVFVAISILDIGEAMAGDYETAGDKREAISNAVRGAAVNTGCMVVGETLMETGHPIAILAGAAIMFLGPMVISALFGDDTPESLYPEEVTDVSDTLGKLIHEYEVVIGDISFAKMTDEQQRAIGVDPNQGSEQGLLQHRMHALYLEAQIMDQFEAAYGKAATGRAGLRELDQMRRQFLAMRAQASTDETDEEARDAISDRLADPARVPYHFSVAREFDAQGRRIPIREMTLRRFKKIEQSLAMDKLTAVQVHDMDQWKSIKDNAFQLIDQVMKKQADDPNWRDIASRQRDLEARVASARYRLDPKAQFAPDSVPRDVPLLSPGSDAYKAYEEELATAEGHLRMAEWAILRAHWLMFKSQGVDVDIEGISANSTLKGFDRQIGVIRDGLRLYERMIDELGGPPSVVGGVEALYREPSARAIYLAQLESDKTYRKQLARLQVNEAALRSLFQHVDMQIASDATKADHNAELAKLQKRFRKLQNTRREGRGLLYAEEVDALGKRESDRAVAFYAPKLGASKDDPVLTREQAVALEAGEYGGKDVLEKRRTIVERLRRVPNLRIPLGPTEVTDSSGNVMHESREVHGIMRLDAMYRDEVVLVGVVGSGNVPGMVNVIAVNDAAVDVLGGYAPVAVIESRLVAATEDDLGR